MNRTNTLQKILMLVILIVPFIIIYVYWAEIPERVPTHWNWRGEPDKFSGSKWATTIIPFVNLVLLSLFFIIPRIDPKKNFEKFQGTYRTLIMAISVFLVFVFFLTFFATLGYEFEFNLIMKNFILLLFLVMGNYLGKIRPNYFIGVRTPWTLENEQVWIKTHRMAGPLWVISSLVMILINFVANEVIFNSLFIPFIIIVAGVPFVYSFLVYKKIDKMTTDQSKHEI
ncbi:MAG: SdpI family protein [Bacteroidota bacterium]